MLENYYSTLWDGNQPWYYKEKPRYSSDNQKGKYFSLFFSVCLLIMDTRYYSGTPLISIVYSWSMKIWLCLPDGHNQHFFLGRSLKFGAFFLFVLPSSVRNGLQSEWKNILIVVSFISSKLKKVTLVCQINIFSLSSYPESDLYLWMAWINNLLCNWSVNCWRSCCCRCRRC